MEQKPTDHPSPVIGYMARLTQLGPPGSGNGIQGRSVFTRSKKRCAFGSAIKRDQVGRADGRPDRKTVRRYVDAATESGLIREATEDELDDA